MLPLPMFRKLKFTAKEWKEDFRVYRMALQDSRTPRAAKVLLGLAVGYALLPIDVIPDFIPVLGHIDDAFLIPLIISLAVKMIPDEVLDECRLRIRHPVHHPHHSNRHSKRRR